MFAFRYMCQFVMWVLSKCIQCLLWLLVKNFSFLIRFIINCFQLVFLFKTVCTVQNVLLSTKALQLRLHSISCRLSWTIFLCVQWTLFIQWQFLSHYLNELNSHLVNIVYFMQSCRRQMNSTRTHMISGGWRTDLMFTRWMKMK